MIDSLKLEIRQETETTIVQHRFCSQRKQNNFPLHIKAHNFKYAILRLSIVETDHFRHSVCVKRMAGS